MTLSTQPYKGSRDFYPEDKRLQNFMFTRMREVCERFGYEEYDAPILEPTDLFLSKGNQEIIDEQTYTFTDRGDRSITIRTEMTPSVSRMVAARRQELPYPLRWYSIPNLWRYERMQRGRLREFWQLNVDVFGLVGVQAEHEIILVADNILKSFGSKTNMYSIQLNSRALTDELFGDYLGLETTQTQMLTRLIDRMKKLSPESFWAQADAIFTPSQREAGAIEKLKKLLEVERLEDLPDGFSTTPSVIRLQQLMDLLEESRVTNCVFDLTLMRGFDYYTDIVFEVVDTDPENNRSMFGGGRYDGLVGAFGVEPIPTVGFGMGDVTLQNFLESHDLLPPLAPVTDAYVVLIGDTIYDKAQHTIMELRRMGVNLAVDSSGRKIEKQIKTAVKLGIHYAIFIGEAELENGQLKLRNLADGSEETHGLERIVTTVKDHRRPSGPVTDSTDIDDEFADL